MRTDPVADLLTCIRNGLHAHKERVEVPWSRLKEAVVKTIVQEGFLKEYSTAEEKGHRFLHIWLKYDSSGHPVLRGIKRVSKPSLRTYVGADQIPSVQNGLGVSVLSTSRGVLADREARTLRIGGEILCNMW